MLYQNNIINIAYTRSKIQDQYCMKIKRCPMYPDIKPCDYNNHGLKEYTPYIIDEKGDTMIDYKWWESLTPYIKNLIINRTRTFILGNVNIPHNEQHDAENDVNKEKPLTTLFQSYLDGFDYNVWYEKEINQYAKNVEIIYLNTHEKNVLLEISERGIEAITNLNDKMAISNIKESIKKSLETIKNKSDQSSSKQSSCEQMKSSTFFVRLSGTSGKNEKPVQEYYSEHNIFQHLVTCDLFRGREYKRDKQVCIIIMPFNENIESKYEFRMFIINNKLVAVCQQKWWELFNYSSEELDIFEDLFHTLEKEYIAVNQKYKSYILDVYVNIFENRCDIIEINPFGAHCGAGSGLFNWVDDYDLLNKLNEDTNDVEFRYLSLVNI